MTAQSMTPSQTRTKLSSFFAKLCLLASDKMQHLTPRESHDQVFQTFHSPKFSHAKNVRPSPVDDELSLHRLGQGSAGHISTKEQYPTNGAFFLNRSVSQNEFEQ